MIPEGDINLQEERRLFYVALTRARKRLYLYAVDKKGTRPSKFITEFLGEGSNDYIKIKKVEPSDDVLERIEFPTGIEGKKEHVLKGRF